MRTAKEKYELKVQKILSKIRDETAVTKKEVKCVIRKRTIKEAKKFRIRIRNSLEDLIDVKQKLKEMIKQLII